MNLLKKVPERIKVKIKYLMSGKKHPNYASLKKEEHKVFVFLAGFYQNLGDMAITYAQKSFLEDIYPNSKIILVPSTETYVSIKTIKRIVSPNDIITTIDGGNMDDLYPSLENARAFVVKSFPNNKIISFPQTVSFRKTVAGQKLLKRSRNIYTKHKDLTICVREEYSLKRVEEYFPGVKIVYCPDIVLYLNEIEPKAERTNILCCLRNDKEQNISNFQRQNIINFLTKNYENVLCKDTVDVALNDCRKDTYEKTLKDFWAILRTCKLVVTDRLHCMIFCAITGTPCIVMDNINKKISGVYHQWLSNVDWIKMIDNCDEKQIEELIQEFLTYASDCQGIRIEEKFLPLVGACKNK